MCAGIGNANARHIVSSRSGDNTDLRPCGINLPDGAGVSNAINVIIT